ncbi:MAG: cobalt transporter CbiM [Planctomycetota bacterium]
MHIYEGVLTATTQGKLVLAGGWALTAVGIGIGLYRMDYERIPRVAVLASVFYVVSMIHVPAGVTAEHLVLNGLMGLILGWAAFPAVFVALLLQALILPQFSGPLVLGVNTLIMAFPGVVCHYLFRRAVRSEHATLVMLAGFAAGAVAVLLSGVLNGGCLILAGESFTLPGQAVMLAHVALAVVEGFVTATTVLFLRKVRPELLEAPFLSPEVARG